MGQEANRRCYPKHRAWPAFAANGAPARVYPSSGTPLTQASKAAPAAIVASFLRDHGVSAAAAASMRPVSTERSAPASRISISGKKIAGLRVHDSYVRA